MTSPIPTPNKLTDANAILVRFCNLHISMNDYGDALKTTSYMPNREVLAELRKIVDAQWPDTDDPVARNLVNRAKTRISLLSFHF